MEFIRKLQENTEILRRFLKKKREKLCEEFPKQLPEEFLKKMSDEFLKEFSDELLHKMLKELLEDISGGEFSNELPK